MCALGFVSKYQDFILMLNLTLKYVKTCTNDFIFKQDVIGKKASVIKGPAFLPTGQLN
jgi:hypothetical protein